jgi:hypothetical protein
VGAQGYTHIDHLCSTVRPHLTSLSLLIHPQELSDNYQQIHLVVKQEKFGEEMDGEFWLRIISFILVGIFNMP